MTIQTTWADQIAKRIEAMDRHGPAIDVMRKAGKSDADISARVMGHRTLLDAMMADAKECNRRAKENGWLQTTWDAKQKFTGDKRKGTTRKRRNAIQKSIPVLIASVLTDDWQTTDAIVELVNAKRAYPALRQSIINALNAQPGKIEGSGADGSPDRSWRRVKK